MKDKSLENVRVLCIDAGRRISDPSEPYIVENEVYTVKYSGEAFCFTTAMPIAVYELNELPGTYDVRLFIPLSNICEKKILKSRK